MPRNDLESAVVSYVKDQLSHEKRDEHLNRELDMTCGQREGLIRVGDNEGSPNPT